MKVLIFVLNDITKLEPLLLKLSENGLKGATIINSVGMAKSLYNSSSSQSQNIIINSLKVLLNNNSDENKTIFTIVDEEQEKMFLEVVNDVVGPLSKKNTGIIFTVPVDSTYGIQSPNQKD